MQITYRLELPDHLRAYFLHTWPLYIALPITSAVIALLMSFSDAQYAAHVILGCAILPVAWYVIIRQTISRQLKSNPAFVAQVTIDIDRTELKIQSEYGSSTSKWIVFQKWTENDRYILLYMSRCLYYAFPKIAFENANDIEKFKEILIENIGK